MLILIFILVGCNSDLYLDKSVHIDKDIYLYHQNGEAGFILARLSKDTNYEPIFNDTIINVIKNYDTMYVSVSSNESVVYYYLVDNGYSIEKISSSFFNKAQERGKLYWPQNE